MTAVIPSASSIPQHADFYAALRNSPFAVEFAAWNGGIAHFFATFISNSRFFGLLFNFTIHKVIKSSSGKLTFMIMMSIITSIFIISGLM